jgi:hypothetical protein
MTAIFFFLASFAGISVLAFIILSYVPAFLNFLLFVVGAFIGMFALVNLYVGVGTWVVRIVGIHTSERGPTGWVTL